MEWEAARAAETAALRRTLRAQDDEERAKWEAEDAAALQHAMAARRNALEQEVPPALRSLH